MEGHNDFNIQYLDDGTYQLTIDNHQYTFTSVKAMTAYISKLNKKSTKRDRKKHGQSLPFDEE